MTAPDDPATLRGRAVKAAALTDGDFDAFNAAVVSNAVRLAVRAGDPASFRAAAGLADEWGSTKTGAHLRRLADTPEPERTALIRAQDAFDAADADGSDAFFDARAALEAAVEDARLARPDPDRRRKRRRRIGSVRSMAAALHRKPSSLAAQWRKTDLIRLAEDGYHLQPKHLRRLTRAERRRLGYPSENGTSADTALISLHPPFSEAVSVALPPAAKDALDRAAKDAGISRPDFLRALIFDAVAPFLVDTD